MTRSTGRIRSPADALRAGSPIGVWRQLLEVHVDLVEDIGTDLRRCHGLSVSEFDVLINIAPREAVRHKDLVRRVVLTRSALSRLIDRLCARGLVVREPDADDQRGVRIRLTDAGVAMRREAARTNDAVVEERFGNLDAKDLAALGRLLTGLRRPEATTQQ